MPGDGKPNRGQVGGRHQFMKDASACFVMECLLGHGRPNAAGKPWSESAMADKRKWFRYILEHVDRTSFDSERRNESWQSLVWYALATRAWEYFESDTAHRAALVL